MNNHENTVDTKEVADNSVNKTMKQLAYVG